MTIILQNSDSHGQSSGSRHSRCPVVTQKKCRPARNGLVFKNAEAYLTSVNSAPQAHFPALSAMVLQGEQTNLPFKLQLVTSLPQLHFVSPSFTVQLLQPFSQAQHAALPSLTDRIWHLASAFAHAVPEALHSILSFAASLALAIAGQQAEPA
jgi:hypothetical protein